jgi:phosphopantetheinyl transferase (holo-ACP synthase)
VYWRIGRPGLGLPAVEDADAWLAAPERDRLSRLRVEIRRHDWLLGRLNLKALLIEMIAERTGQRPSPSDLFIDRRGSGAPVVRLIGAQTSSVSRGTDVAGSLTVSNSHSHGFALAAAAWTDHVGAEWQVGLGADLEFIEPRSDGFIRDFLTDDEQRFCGDANEPRRPLRANLVWSAKEAVLKVLQRGLSADTWWLTCLPEGEDHAPPSSSHWRTPPPGPGVFLDPTTPGWHRFSVYCDARLQAGWISFAGLWTEIDGFVATLAVGAGTPSRAPA